MARIVYYVAASVDGFIADSAGGVDWLPDAETGDSGYAAFYAGVEALVMGRRTYDQVLSFGKWPYPGKPAYVFTHSPPHDCPPEVQFVRGSAVDFGQDIAARHSGTVWLVGGADLADQFRQSDLIDEYQVFVIPTILGQGVALFSGSGSHTLLDLDSAQTHVDGVLQLRYSPRNTGHRWRT